MIRVYTDGLAEPNPGVGTFGYVIFRDGKKVVMKHGVAGERVTNNYAEYEGLVETLRELLSRFGAGGEDEDDVVIHSDSRLLVRQMSGDWKVSKKAFRSKEPGSYVDKYLQAVELAKRFNRIRFVWVPREENLEADQLSRDAYRDHLLGRDREHRRLV